MYVPPDSYRLLYKLDFTAQSTQSMSPDGAYTIDSHSWNSANNSNANSFGVVNGTGLVINVKSGNFFYDENARTAPLLFTDLSTFVSQISFATMRGLRIRMRVLLTSSTQNFQFPKLAIEWATTPTAYHHAPGRGFVNTGIATQHELVTNSVAKRSAVDISSDDVIELVWRMDMTSDMRTSLYSSGFPKSSFKAGLSGSIGTNVMRDTTTGHPRLVLAAEPASASTTYTATFTHLEIAELVS